MILDANDTCLKECAVIVGELTGLNPMIRISEYHNHLHVWTHFWGVIETLIFFQKGSLLLG